MIDSSIDIAIKTIKKDGDMNFHHFFIDKDKSNLFDFYTIIMVS